jgi:hypothetical protein
MFFIHSEINVSRPYITQGTITTLEILWLGMEHSV